MVIMAILIAARLYGSASFQDIIISLSQRTRGKAQRVHTNNSLTRNVFIRIISPPRKNIEVRNPSDNIIPYSLIKMRANNPPPYSMLNPDTISDSPSARSKGVRFASARHSNTHIRNSGAEHRATHIPLCIMVSLQKSYVFSMQIEDSTNKNRHTSYDTTWATARWAPSKAYFLFDPHPIKRKGYTPSLMMAKMIKTFSPPPMVPKQQSNHPHPISISVILTQGPAKNILILFIDILGNSFVSSFMASAIGCLNPKTATFVGPFRQWASPMIFRSIKVKKATLSSTPTNLKTKSILNIMVS